MKKLTPEELARRRKINSKLLPLVLFLILILCWMACHDSSDTEVQKQTVSANTIEVPQKHTPTEALIMSREFVKRNLKAPSTAEFSHDCCMNVIQLNDSTFDVTSYVDAQNSFGAMLRINYSCTITFSKDDMASCGNLYIDDIN